MLKALKRQALVVFVLMLVFSVLGSTVSANATLGKGTVDDGELKQVEAATLSLENLPALDSKEVSIKTIENFEPDKNSGIAVNMPISTNAVYDVPNPLLNVSDSLELTDPEDIFFFSVNTDRSMVLRLLSENPDYLAQLYIVDWSTGQAYPTSVGAYAQTQIALKNLPAGDYLFLVYSEGNVGESYTLRMNATNPANYSLISYISETLSIVMASYPNGDVYSSGTLIYNSKNTGGTYANLDWTREFYNSWGSGYTSRTHKIYNPTIRSVSAPVSYSSSYASSGQAILIYVGLGTGFMYHEAYYQSGPDHIYESSFYDTLGKRTPRNLDEDDLSNWGDHILVYDLNTNKTIDFFSVLNFYYAAGIEPLPTIRPLN